MSRVRHSPPLLELRPFFSEITLHYSTVLRRIKEYRFASRLRDAGEGGNKTASRTKYLRTLISNSASIHSGMAGLVEAIAYTTAYSNMGEGSL